MATTPHEGKFHGSHHLALLGHLSRSEVSGLLEITAEHRSAWITFLEGQVTWAETNDPTTTAGQVICDAGMISKERLRDLEAAVPDEDSLMERLSEELHRSRSDLEPWRMAAVRARLAAGVGWGSGTWRFIETADASLDGIDPRLLPQISLVRVGWEAVLSWVTEDRARREVLDPTAGPLMPGPGLDEALEQLRLPPALSSLRDRLHGHADPAALVAELGARSPELVRILWLLEHGGWTIRPDRKPPGSDGVPATMPSASLSHRRAPSPEAEMVLSLWDSRQTLDLYDLLDVRPYASTASVARSAREVKQRFSRVSEDPATPESTRAIARNLLAAALLAEATLTDEGRRTDYDARRKSGRGPSIADLVGQIHAEPRHGGGPIEQARKKLEAGELQAAATAARRALFLEPENPDVLAEAAQVLWSSRHAVSPDEDPEELINRALALHPGHERARQVRDIIANQRAAGHGTRRTLMGWLRSKS